ncbi:MAG: sulfite exporter TauE/SafE family protein [Casimicrobium sp.]
MNVPVEFAPLALCALIAGIVRGFSGFGLSAVLVASGAFFVEPRLLIPSAQLLEIVASIWMIPSVWKDVNWKWLTPMAAGYAISIPLGVAALAYAPSDMLRVGGCVLLFVASSCLLLNARPKLPDGFPLRFGTGIVAGFMAGASSLGGMVASVMLFAVSIPAKNLRATLIVLFFGSALYSTSWGTWHGVVTQQTFVRAAWLAIPLLIGIAIGSRGFHLVSEAQFRKAVLAILAVLSVAGIASVLLK